MNELPGKMKNTGCKPGSALPRAKRAKTSRLIGVDEKVNTFVGSVLVTAAAALLLGVSIVGAAQLTEEELLERNTLNCGTLVYSGDKTSVCFADRFLRLTCDETNVEVGLSFKEVDLSDAGALFATPFVVFSGEGSFRLNDRERENLRRYLELGGFMVASPGCSDSAWDRAFRRELAVVFPDIELTRVPMDHPAFSTVYQIDRLTDRQGKRVLVEGLFVNGRLALIHSQEGLNDVSHADGCCCCGGNEIRQCANVNVNLLTFAIVE